MVLGPSISMHFYLFSSAIDTWLVYFGDILKESLDHKLEMQFKVANFHREERN